MPVDDPAAPPAGARRRLTDEPPSLRTVVLVGIAVGLVVAGFSLAGLDANPRGWALTALLTFLAVGFEEGSRRAVRLQIRLRSQLRADMTSVWIVAAGLALAPGRAVVMLAVLYTYVWFRQNRPAGELLHRKLYNASSNVVAAVTAGLAADFVAPRLASLPLGLGGALSVVLGVVTAIAVSRFTITVALVALGVRGRDLLGSVHDNLIEVATPCLGGLVAFVAQYEPWLAVLVIAPMVTLQRGAVIRELEAAAVTDAKTGLLNAVAWEELANRELTRARRNSTSLATLIIDIDRFKVVNDRFGHLVGDKVLAGVARAVGESLRGYDGLGRFGGEEFVAVLPEADERSALVVAERVRIRVNQLQVADFASDLDNDPGQSNPHLSVSIGVAVLNSDGAELPELLHAADQALYRAKWNGRNQVQLARRGDQLPDMINL